MSQTVITKAFIEWKAQQAVNSQPVTLDEFVFANVPGLDVTKPISNTEAIPADSIVHRQAVSKTGVVNANSVVYSVTLGADVGDFDFNWIGLISKASGTLAMIIHAPTQRKVKNASGQQGNVLVRSMLMEYSGAQVETGIITLAETWQIDFTARLAGMDEAVRLAAIDIYGAGAFFDNGFLVGKTGTQYFVTSGLAYVGGLRAALAANQNVPVSAKPTKVWVDVCYQGTLTSAYRTDIKFTVAATLENYNVNGVAHYVFALANIDVNGVITDLRPKGSSQYLRRDKNLTDIADPAVALNTLNGVPTTRKINKKALTGDIDLVPDDVGALPADGTAVAAKKLETARKIAGVAFDGTKDIAISAGNVGAVPTTGGEVGYLKNATFYGTSADSWEGAGGFASQYTTPSAPFFIPHGYAAPKDVSSYAPIIKGMIQTQGLGWATAISFGAYTTGGGNHAQACINVVGDNGVSSAWLFNPNDSSFYSPGDIKSGKSIDATGDVSGAYIASRGDLHADLNISSNGFIQSGAGVYDTPGVRCYSPNYQPTPEAVNAITRDVCSVAGFVSGNANDAYMRHMTTNEVVILARRDWVNGNFITGQRQASAQWSGPVGGGLQVPAGCVVIGARNNGSSDVARMGLLYAAEQVCINGNWVTIGLV